MSRSGSAQSPEGSAAEDTPPGDTGDADRPAGRAPAEARDPGGITADAAEHPASRRWHRPSRRATALLVSAVPLLALLLVALLLPVPYVRLSPGPTFNIIGDVDGTPVVQISGTQTYPTSGHLDMTTVSEAGGPRGGLTLGQALASWLDPEDAVLPRELLYPDDVTGEQVQQDNAVAFSTSQSDAIAAAMGYLDRPVEQEILVASVSPGSPADGQVRAGDVILAIDGTAVTTPAQVGEAVRSEPVGTTFELTLLREGAEQEVSVTSAASPDDATVPYLGVSVGVLFTAPFEIDFTLEDIGGPSAGLMFSMGLIDKLTPGELNGGRFVAGTGTITPDGEIGPIGGIRQKLAGAAAAGATLFLMPADHCAEAAGFVPEGLTVVPVETLDEAVAAVESYVAGSDLPACPVAG